MDLHDALERIETREDLAAFVLALSEDFLVHRDEWESWQLPDYLEALHGFIGAMDGYYKNKGEPMPENVDWQIFGMLLLAAKYQE